MQTKKLSPVFELSQLKGEPMWRLPVDNFYEWVRWFARVDKAVNLYRRCGQPEHAMAWEAARSFLNRVPDTTVDGLCAMTREERKYSLPKDRRYQGVSALMVDGVPRVGAVEVVKRVD